MNEKPAESNRVELSVVAPVFNEGESIVEFARQLRAVLGELAVTYEVLFVDDGSTDESVSKIDSLGWAQARVMSFVANAGHMAALDAGYRASSGRFVISLDSDLQHPPEVIPELYRTAVDAHLDVVYAVRGSRREDSPFKRMSARLYYRTMRALTDIELKDSAADFRLISQRVVDVIRRLPEGATVFRLLIPSLGFPSGTVDYTASDRFAGTSKYTLRRMLSLSNESAIGFTTKPLTISIRIGVLVSIVAILGFVYVLVTYFTGHALQGWASVLSTLLLMFGLLFVILGVFGLYLGSLVRATGRRPAYVIEETRGDDSPDGKAT